MENVRNKSKKKLENTNLSFRFLKDFTDDFKAKGYSDEEMESLAYYDMYDRMEAMNANLGNWLKTDLSRVTQMGKQINRADCKAKGEWARQQLNKEQAEAMDAIMEALESGSGGLFFLDGPGGSGKTFVYNCIANTILGSGQTILPIAWTGIAASLLPDGRTVASVCKLDIRNGCKTSSLGTGTHLAKLLSEVVVILWDEAPMSPKAALETVDQLFRDITNVNLPFGGKVVVLGGDFRQVLPVVDKGRVEDQIANSIKKSPQLWPLFKTFHLKTNMRLTGDALEWKNELLRIGDGKVGAPMSGLMPIPDGLAAKNLVDEIFDEVLEKKDIKKLSQRAILTPRNKEALDMNNRVLEKMKLETEKIYTSLDEILTKDGQPNNDSMNFTTEFLNRMTPSGMPPHELRLKKGAIVMLLRNLDVKNSMCNGTRFVVEEMGRRVLQCKFVNGPREGDTVLIPKIKLHYDQNLPFILSRLQFPVRLAFAMTINKSQGQTFEKIGLKLDEPIFSHGQLYVALSRTTTKEGIKIESTSGTVNNIVYQEVLL